MARNRSAEPVKQTRPQAKNSPMLTPRRKLGRKIEPETTSRPAEPSIQGEPYPIVGVGASAGGFEAFRERLGALRDRARITAQRSTWRRLSVCSAETPNS